MSAEMLEIAFFGIAILAYLYKIDRRVSALEARVSSLEARVSSLEANVSVPGGECIVPGREIVSSRSHVRGFSGGAKIT